MEAETGYQSLENFEGLSINGGELIVDDSKWALEERVHLIGSSGFRHYVDYLLKSNTGETIILQKVDEDLSAAYLALGKIQVMREDLSPDAVAVLCFSSNIREVISRIGIQVELPILSALSYGKSINIGIRAIMGNSEEMRVRNESKSDRKVRRDRTHLIMEVMSLLREDKSRITKIIYKCNLNHKIAISLIDELIEKGFLRIVESEESERSYLLTQEGSEALRTLERFYSST